MEAHPIYSNNIAARDYLINTIIKISRFVFCWVPGGDPSIGHAVWMSHSLAGPLMIALFFILPRLHFVKFIIVMITIMVHTSQYVFNGCIVTQAEQRLRGGDDQIPDIDRFLMMANVHPAQQTRMAATVSFSTAMMYILLIALVIEILQELIAKRK